MTSAEAGFWVGLALVVAAVIFAAIGGACDDSKDRSVKQATGPLMMVACALGCMGAVAWIKAAISAIF